MSADVSIDGAGGDLPALWAGFARGDTGSRDRLLSLFYDEFRSIARRVLNGDGPRLQIQPTDLAHEAAIRILRSDSIAANDQRHFLALGARVMRMTLIDEVRRQRAACRNGEFVTLWTEAGSDPGTSFDIEAFDDALRRLAAIEPDGARVVELRFFVGLTLEEVASVMSLSESTVQRRWRSARAWLLKELQGD
jgi:RNA polymerase sigma factor (TIGR02999 family)